MHDHSHACRKPSLFQSKVSWCSVCWQHRIIWVSIHAFCVAFNSFIIFSLFEVFIALKEKRIKQNGLSPRALPEEWKQSASLSRTAPAHRNVTKKRQKQAWIQEKGSLSTPLRIQGLRKKLQYFGLCSQAASVWGDQGTPLSVLKLHKSPDLLVRETTDFRVGL